MFSFGNASKPKKNVDEVRQQFSASTGTKAASVVNSHKSNDNDDDKVL